MGNLLINEPPLQVLPSLAVKLESSDKALMLQQIHYWLNRSNNIRDGFRWIYNSAAKWHEQFPWLSEKTIQRYLKDLEKRGLLITGNYNKAKFDRTKWYRIDYDALDNLGSALGLAVPTIGTERPNGMGLTVPTNTNRLPETTTETTKENSAANAAPEFPWQSVIDYLNEKTGKHFKHTNTNKGLVMARQHDGFSAEDMQKVIDHQCKLWFNNKDMAQYLRPSTLFRASKFEGYLNAVPDEPKHEGREYWTGG